MASFSCACAMDDMVDSEKHSAKAAPEDHTSCAAPCHTESSLLITAMNPSSNTHRRSSLVAEASVMREETALVATPIMPPPTGASKSIILCPSHMEKMTMALDSSLDVPSADGVPTNHQIGDLSYDEDGSMSQPVVSASTLSTFSSGVQIMQDHQQLIEGVVSEDLNSGHSNNTMTRRVRTRLLSSSCNRRGHCARNNYGGLRTTSRVLPILIMSLCWISLAAANVFGAATTTTPATTTANSITTTDAPLTTTTPCNYSVVDDDLISITNATTTAATTTTNATTTMTTTTTTTTTTVGGLKLIDGDDDDDYIPPCRTFNKGQCQQNSQHCTWKFNSWSCDYSHLPVTSTSTPTTLNSRAPPPPPPPPTGSLSNAPTTQPTVDSTATPPTGGNKGLTDTPTLDPSPPPTPPPTILPTRLPTPLPTPLPTAVPTPRPTTKSPTPLPTMKPTTKAPTKEPTDWPTYSPTLNPTRKPTSRPTRNPTPNPTAPPTPKPTPKPSGSPSMVPSGSPSVSPSMSPTASPSDFPSTTPTNFPTISPKPTPLVWPSASPTLSSSPTVSPSNRPSSSPSASPSALPTVSPTTSSPTAADETGSPTVGSVPITPAPTPPSTLALKRVLIEKEPTSITLNKRASKMVKGSTIYDAWEKATIARVKRYTKQLIKETSGEKDVDVEVTIEDVIQRLRPEGRRRLGGGGGGEDGNNRILQEEEMKPLWISFRTTLEFYSKQSEWDGSKLIAAGFITAVQQAEYISELQKEGQGSFGTVESMEMSVNGQVITESIEGKEMKAQGNSIMYIIAGAVGGVLLLFAIVGGVYYKKRRNRRRNGSSGRYPEKQAASDFYKGSGNTGTMMSSPPNKSFPPPPPQTSSPVGDYFGTIEPRPGEDDVSTLGDPYIGDVLVNQDMGGDNTVTESLMSSGNDMYVYGISRPRMNTGDSSRMGGGSTINTGSNRMTFQDDGTMEEFYGTPDATNYHSEKDSDFEHITVVARSGVLGIVIDNPSRTTPVVHAIKESSILNGRVHVGDLLMSVDEVDCRGMTAVAVSKLIGSRSQNPTRTLRLLRGATLDDVRGDSSHVRY